MERILPERKHTNDDDDDHDDDGMCGLLRKMSNERKTYRKRVEE